MEKFGIFDLLDALSAFSDAAHGAADGSDARPAPPQEAPRPKRGGAFASLIAKQEAISRRIDENKRG